MSRPKGDTLPKVHSTFGGSSAVALLVLLARAAPAGVIASDPLLLGAHDRLLGLRRDHAAAADRRGRRHGCARARDQAAAGGRDRVRACDELVLVAEVAVLPVAV